MPALHGHLPVQNAPTKQQTKRMLIRRARSVFRVTRRVLEHDTASNNKQTLLLALLQQVMFFLRRCSRTENTHHGYDGVEDKRRDLILGVRSLHPARAHHAQSHARSLSVGLTFPLPNVRRVVGKMLLGSKKDTGVSYLQLHITEPLEKAAAG